MNKEFIPYEQALELKGLGFDEPCFGKFYYNQLEIGGNWCNNDFKEDPNIFISAPTFSQVFRWFREKYNLLGGVYSNASGWAWEIHDNVGGTHRFASEYTGDCLESGMFTSFEKAELDCIKKLIEIVKKK